MMKLKKNELSGTTSTEETLKANGEEYIRLAPELCTLPRVVMKTRLGCRCWRKPGLRLMATTQVSMVDSLGKSMLKYPS